MTLQNLLLLATFLAACLVLATTTPTLLGRGGRWRCVAAVAAAAAARPASRPSMGPSGSRPAPHVSRPQTPASRPAQRPPGRRFRKSGGPSAAPGPHRLRPGHRWE